MPPDSNIINYVFATDQDLEDLYCRIGNKLCEVNRMLGSIERASSDFSKLPKKFQAFFQSYADLS